MKKINVLFYSTLIMGIAVLWLSFLIAQTPPINTERITKLEESQNRQDDRMEDMQKQHAALMAQVASVQSSTNSNRDLLIGFSSGLILLMAAQLLQGRKTHRLMNGAQTILQEDLKGALENARRLRSELTDCLNREKCPLLIKEARAGLAVNEPPEQT